MTVMMMIKRQTRRRYAEFIAGIGVDDVVDIDDVMVHRSRRKPRKRSPRRLKSVSTILGQRRKY